MTWVVGASKQGKWRAASDRVVLTTQVQRISDCDHADELMNHRNRCIPG